MRYQIMGQQTGEPEILDQTEDLEDAQYLLEEYRSAFGNTWRVYVEVDNKA